MVGLFALSRPEVSTSWGHKTHQKERKNDENDKKNINGLGMGHKGIPIAKILDGRQLIANEIVPAMFMRITVASGISKVH